MATTFRFVISTSAQRVSAARLVLEKSHELVRSLEQELSEYIETSAVYRLNHSRPFEPFEFGDKSQALLERAFFLESLTDRAFTPLAKSRTPMPTLNWNEEHSALHRTDESTWLGLGAIGKGFALDCVREELAKEGFEDFLLSAGGSSQILSGYADPTTGAPWTWAWSFTKDEKGEPMGLVFRHENGQPISIGVSGTQEQGEHIIDLKKGEAPREVASALIAAPSAADSDALSTALFVRGMEALHEPLASLPSPVAAATVDRNGVPRWNRLFQHLWGAMVAFALFVALPCFADDEVVDLGDAVLDEFMPYDVNRNGWWILLPVFALLVVILHLRNSRPKIQAPAGSLPPELLTQTSQKGPEDKTQ